MGKLFGQIFKEDIKTIILWLFLPLVTSLLFMKLISVFGDSNIMALGLLVSITLLVIGPIITLALAASNDDKRFFGDKAAFYSVLPYDSSEVTAARYLNYVALGFVIVLSSLINYLIMMFSQVFGSASFNDFLNAINLALSKIDGKVAFAVIITLFSIGIAFVSMIMFANTAGHLKFFGKLSKSSSKIIFAILFIIAGILFSRFQASIFADYMVDVNSGSVTVSIANGFPINFKTLLPVLFNFIIAIGLYAWTYFIHKNKLSVD